MVLEVEQVGTQNGAQNGARREPGPWRWTVESFAQIASTGVFEGQRVELIDGEIRAMMPMGPLHLCSTTNLSYVLIDKLPRSLRVLVQMPITLSSSSQPEPDIAVVDASVIQNQQAPTTAHLVIEVSDSTLRSDRSAKAALYASAQIAEYWIVDVNARTIEVLREPVPNTAEPLGWRYSSIRLLSEDAQAAPLCAPDVSFAVRELLP
jgi:Uma2 family endonuclease